MEGGHQNNEEEKQKNWKMHIYMDQIYYETK